MIAPTSITPVGLPSSFRGGWIAWLVFCLLAVALRGVRWDETYEHAQVLLGVVPYPPGHPLARYVSSVYSIQPFLTALHFYLWPNEVVVNGLRNLLMLAATIMPVYLFVAWLTRNVVWGCAAAVLVLQGALLELDGSYPFTVWPDIFSNGPIGQGYALLMLFLLIKGCDRSGGVLLGLMPCVHIGQAPALALWAILWGLWRLRRDGIRGERTLIVFTLFGLALSAAFAIVPHTMQLDAPEDGPYAVTGDVDAIWQGYTQFADPHRRLPSGNGHVALVAALILGGVLMQDERKSRGTFGPWSWLFAYVAVTATIVWGCMAVHMALGPHTPFLVLGWMPYRLMNHVPPLLLVMIAAMLHTRPWGAVLLAGAVMYGIVAPWAIHVIPMLAPYAPTAVAIPFFLAGAAWGIYAQHIPERRHERLRTGLILIAPLAVYHQWGALCTAAGLALGVFGPRISTSWWRERFLWIPTAAALAILLTLQGMAHNHMPRSEFDNAIARSLWKGDAHAMLAGRPDEFTLQARTGHPVLVESATASLISYMPALGPTINQIFDDFYGIRFDRPPDETRPGWETVWATRTVQEWQALAEKYNVHYLVAPENLDMPLELQLEKNGSRLYKIPKKVAASSAAQEASTATTSTTTAVLEAEPSHENSSLKGADPLLDTPPLAQHTVTSRTPRARGSAPLKLPPSESPPPHPESMP